MFQSGYKPPTAKVMSGISIAITSILTMQKVSDQARREGLTTTSIPAKIAGKLSSCCQPTNQNCRMN